MELLKQACARGDLAFIQSRLAQDDPTTLWLLLDAAYRAGSDTIVTAIQDSSLVTMYDMLKSACYFGDEAFVDDHLDDCLVDHTADHSANQPDAPLTDNRTDLLQGLLFYACVRGHIRTAHVIQEKMGAEVLLFFACGCAESNVGSKTLPAEAPAIVVGKACLKPLMPQPTCKVDYAELTDYLVDLFEEGLITCSQFWSVCEVFQLSLFGVVVSCIKKRKLQMFNAEMYDRDYLTHSYARIVMGVNFRLEVMCAMVYMYWTERLDKECLHFILGSNMFMRNRPDFMLQDKVEFALRWYQMDLVKSTVGWEQDIPLEWELIISNLYEIGKTDLAKYIYDIRHPVLSACTLYFACYAGDLQIIQLHIYSDLEIDWEFMLFIACVSGHVDIIRSITENRVSLPCDNQLLLACLNGDKNFIRSRIYGIKHTNIVHAWAIYLHAACLTNHTDIADVLIEVAHDMKVNFRELYRKMLFVMYCCIPEPPNIDNRTLEYISLKTGIDIPPVMLPYLHACCYRGHSYTLIKAIDVINSGFQQWRVMKINKPGIYKWTPLHCLCLGKNQDLEHMLMNGIFIDVFSMGEQNELKPLKQRGLDIEKQSTRVLLLHILIQHEAEVDCLDYNQQTPLHLACSSGAYHLVLTLLNYGANIDKLDAMKMSPVACASLHGHSSIVDLLLTRNCDAILANRYEQNPIHHACLYNHVECVRVLVKVREIVNKQDFEGQTPLLLAAMAENIEILRLLSKHNADVNIADKEGQTPLHKAAIRGSCECARVLLENTANIDERDITGCTPVYLAASHHHAALVDLLLEHHCDVNATSHLGNAPLHVATLPDILTAHIRHGAVVNQQNHCGETPLLAAAARLDLAAMRTLVENEADVHGTDNMGRGLLHAAVTSLHHGSALRTLSQQSEGVKTEQHQPFTVITLTVANSTEVRYACADFEHKTRCDDLRALNFTEAFNISVVEYIVSLGVNIDARDYNESSALHLAAEAGLQTAVHVLLQNKAPPHARDKFGHMPVMLALQHPSVFSMLWDVSRQHLTEDDWKRLTGLGYWFDARNFLQKYMLNSSQDGLAGPQMPKTLSFEVDPVKLCDWLRSSREELPEFMSGWLPSLQPLTFVQHHYVIEVMDMVMSDLQKAVAEIDPLVAFVIKRCGSEDEKTKVILKDEEDCSCVQENIRFDMFETPTQPGHPVWKAFVELVAKPEYYVHLERVLDEKKRLSQSKLCQHFGNAVAKALADPQLWKKYPQLMRVTVKDITAASRKISALLVIWSDEVYPLMEISVDLVPVIDLSGWYPAWCNQHPLIKHIDCIALPKWKMTHSIDLDLMEVGVFQWRPWFDMMPEEMRQGFRLAKVVRDKAVCPKLEEWDEVHAGEFISTYYLKQCIIGEYMDFYDKKAQGLYPDIHSDLHYARKIYERLEDAFWRRDLGSVFIPDYNLLNDDKFVTYRETATSYARLCRRLLTPESAAHFRKAFMGMLV